MGIPSNILPENILKRMDKRTREKELPGNSGRTAEECRERWESGEEKKLQSLIANFLNLKEIYFETDRFGKRTGAAPGRPDFRVVYRGRFIGIEVKAEKGVLSKDQVKTLERIRKSGGVTIIAFGLPAVQEALRAIDKDHLQAMEGKK